MPPNSGDLVSPIPTTHVLRGRGDPRPDLERDAAAWSSLLMRAQAIDVGDGDGVYWTLLGCRAIGAELVETDDGSFRLQVGDADPADYAAVRSHLVRNLAAVRTLLGA